MVTVCADMLGGMQWILEDAVEYAKTRQQFGKPIGSFQAVQHMWPICCCGPKAPARPSISRPGHWMPNRKAPSAAATAKIYTSDASREVANRGVQVHGGIGFTWEHDLQLFYKRSKASEILFGDAGFHRARLADLVFANA